VARRVELQRTIGIVGLAAGRILAAIFGPIAAEPSRRRGIGNLEQAPHCIDRRDDGTTVSVLRTECATHGGSAFPEWPYYGSPSMLRRSSNCSLLP
jgi:hypothetical protein